MVDMKLLSRKSKKKKHKKRHLFINDPKYILMNINKLPQMLKNKIYILFMRQYWRNTVPITSKSPTWYTHAVKQEKLLYEARKDNIHFLHLPCNTLPENKKYIVGCQCFHCTHAVDPVHKLIQLKKQAVCSLHFNRTVPNTDSKWNEPYEYYFNHNTNPISVITGMPIFNPDYEIEYLDYDDNDDYYTENYITDESDNE